MGTGWKLLWQERAAGILWEEGEVGSEGEVASEEGPVWEGEERSPGEGVGGWTLLVVGVR